MDGERDLLGNGPDDLAANRLGHLGDGQRHRLVRAARVELGLAVLGVGILAAIVLFVANRPYKPAQLVAAGLVGAALLGVGINHYLRVRQSLDGGVECVEGPVEIRLQRQNGYWLHVADRQFRLPVRPWHVAPGERYRVYVATRSSRIVAFEPSQASSS